VYDRNRYYDPRAGRFTQEDPIGLADGVNLYGYAGGEKWLRFSEQTGSLREVEQPEVRFVRPP
jgi:RHS repeat-associated protein